MTCTILWKYIWNVRACITDWIMVQSCVSSFPSSYFTSESFCWLFKYSEWRKSCTIVPNEWKEIVRILTFRNKAIPQWHVTNNELYKRQNCSTAQLLSLLHLCYLNGRTDLACLSPICHSHSKMPCVIQQSLTLPQAITSTMPMRLLVTAPTQWDLRPPTVRRPAPQSAYIWYLHMRSYKPTRYLEYPFTNTHKFNDAICLSEFSYCYRRRM